ncbi:MAG: alcohol dehydrogenase catalytic domain-containing protein [Bryobacteraceae bacterium]|nr:alcohol dehydrogenase catalytic domain-containing protein [Bryobacteraceae bacterium]MDW8379348.1 alcohol dehydrogenase catalytic domain-containing protein [Bryobacterales bacterium]
MKVAQLEAVRQFRLVDLPVAEPGPSEVQVAVKTVGICGSDLHYYAEGGIGDTPCVYPAVIGHEPAGIVLRTGAQVTGWQAGDRVILEPAIYCYHCEFCLTGRHNVCANLRFLSTPGEPGFFRELVNLPVQNLLPLPPGLSFAEGSLAEPLAVVLHSLKFAQPQPGETAAVFGAGPIGLMTLSVLKLSGIQRVWVIEPVAERRHLAVSLGADAALDPRQVDPVAEIKRDTAQRGVDLVVDCAAKDRTMSQCLYAARNGGRVVYTGIPSEAVVALEFHEARRKELTLFNVRRSNHETIAAVRLLQEHRRLFAPLLTHHFPLERIADAFETVEHYREGACKVMIEPS